ncbi:protein LEKR1 isoform X2 [Hemibagrus wyckioides]|nr:protein LEKR1 isoform X2 [Hemibagrus wyckioides]
MEQEETTCRYCGVSYLILHEFQRLQERLREVERELERERGRVERERDSWRERERESVERERESRDKLQHSHLQLEELTAANQLYKDRVKALTLQVSQADSKLVDLRTENKKTREELESELKCSVQLRSVCERQRVLLQDAGPVLQCVAAELREVKEDLSLLSQDQTTALILQHCSTAASERVVLQQEVTRAEEEVGKLQQEIWELQERLHVSDLETETLKNCIQNQELLQNQNQQALKQEVESLQEELQKSHSERAGVERLLESKRKEEEGRSSHLQQQCDEQSATILSLTRDLREKEVSWLSCQHRCESLQQQLLTWKRKEAETRRDLEGAIREGQKIRDEREALMHAQTEELQEMEDTFRRRLELAEEQGSKWRRDAALELDIERQKNEQLIQKYHQLQDKLPTLVQSASRELKEEVSALEARLREREEELKCEREEASAREGRLLREQQAEVEHLQTKLQERHQEALELQRAHRDLLQLREENSTLHQENSLLQETVRRECEERADLTAALSLAREQLLGVRQIAVNSSIARSSATSSLPSLSAGHGRDAVTGDRSTASWHGNSRQLLPALPRLATERPAPLTKARHRISRKDKRSC